MDARAVAQQHAAGRAVVGAALVLAPGLAARSWIGREASGAGTQVITTAMGARDLAIALGALRALRSGREVRPWVLAGVLGDTADLVATLRARDALPSAAVVGVGAVAAGSAAVGVWLARAVG